ncbi:Uncharacterised protein [Mycobacteroides abscessus subsp. abscessus]|nr:Uncharacterised protein [Mycobacteroides abscessus subsp. abscessus]
MRQIVFVILFICINEEKIEFLIISHKPVQALQSWSSQIRHLTAKTRFCQIPMCQFCIAFHQFK